MTGPGSEEGQQINGDEVRKKQMQLAIAGEDSSLRILSIGCSKEATLG